MKLKKTLAALLATLLVGASATVTVSALEPHGTGIKMRDWLSNDPNYQFSAAYKTSVWYENFTSLELDGNDRNNVLRIAISQLGYHEGNSAADFDGMNTNGKGDYIEYARLLVPNWNNNSYYWCACFVNWCLNQAHFDKASSEISCGNWVSELKTMGMWQTSAAYGGTYVPKPADFIFFDWEANNSWSDHIGFVLYTTATHVYTIEGNADDNVTARSYKLTDPRIIGYGTPPYDEGGVPTIDYSYAQGMPRGIYVVNSTSASLTDQQGANPFYSVPLGSSVHLFEVKGDYALVSYDGKRGYLPANCLYLMTEEVALTYNANGGEGAPIAEQVTLGKEIAVSSTVPTLAGDTFLGWSTVPYNAKVDVLAGDSITLTEGTVLYAVWEKHSLELAAQAAAQGLIPEYERPAAIRNSSALLLGTLDGTDLFNDCGNTQVTLTKDESAGKVLSLVTEAQRGDPYVTLAYGDLCESLCLAPVTGDQTAYVILRIKDASLTCGAMGLSFNGGVSALSDHPAAQGDWHYVVFDLANGGFTGDLGTLRLDWQVSDSEGESTLLISDIYFVSNEAAKDAVLAGKYIYPVQELSESESGTETDTKPAVVTTATTSPTEPVTSPQDQSESDTTFRTDSVTEDESTEPLPRETGCHSVLQTSAWIGTVLLVLVPYVWKKKED